MAINHNIELLFKYNISNKDSLVVYHESTRNIKDLNVLKCKKSDVIVLEENKLSETYYEANTYYELDLNVNYHKNIIRKSEEPKSLQDDIRRFESYEELIKDSYVLDFGCGMGDFVRLTQEISKKSIGLELNNEVREYNNNNGITCIKSLAELNDDKFDLITLNHVFEHLNNPINILVDLQKYLKDDGVIIIEVPNARDILIETFNLESFKDFTFWGDHLILHTKKSLEVFATNSGLHVKSIEGIQRHPISNHFNWLLNNQPFGHHKFDNLNKDDFHKHYEKFLDSIDQTDTLIGYFSKNI